MIAHELQGWLTLRGTPATNVIRQSESEWLTLEGFRDLSVWIQIAQSPFDMQLRVDLETAPTPDETLFKAVTSTTVTTVGVFFVASRAKFATDPLVPLARHLRWSVALGNPYANWGLTFRVLLCANPTVADFRMMRDGKVFGNPQLGAGAQ